MKEYSYVSPEEAWDSFKEDYFEGMEELAAGFEEDNPLADSASYTIFLKDLTKQEEMFPGLSLWTESEESTIPRMWRLE